MTTEPKRCSWCGEHEDYIAYHDNEWGRVTKDTRRLFEKICLEGFQAGLSWLTILRKRENFRKAFHNFEPSKVAQLSSADVDELMKDAGIIRHRGKIQSVVNNAQQLPALEEEFGSLGAFIWQFEPDKPQPPKAITHQAANISQTDASRELSKALKKRGWSFVGPTTMYALLQSCGVVNDHVDVCAWHTIVEQERAAFARPDDLTSMKSP